MDIFVKEISSHFGLTLYGGDILISEEEGLVYLIDLNYFSSYEDLPRMQVEKSIREMIVRKHREFTKQPQTH